jgi:acyl transferase domain-containing protein
MKAHTGNFISEHSVFDAAFFRISPREAKSMDPQQRVLLHAAYHALENAGYVPDPASEPQSSGMGVWVGAATTDWVHNLRGEVDLYHSMGAYALVRAFYLLVDRLTAIGTIGAFLSGRISYAMKLNGPSVTVNTACSSSLVAIYQACRALMNGDCNAALAGGVNMITSPDVRLFDLFLPDDE